VCGAGDETRLSLVTTLSRGNPLHRSADRWFENDPAGDHQALRVLQSAGIVHSVRTGRESRFEFDPQPLNELHEYLGRVSARWDQVLRG